MRAAHRHGVKSGSTKGAKDLEAIFGPRPRLDDDQFYARFFDGTGVSREVAIGVRRAFIDHLPLDMIRLEPSDSFKGELNFVWSCDSLADVELICAIERRFAISITEKEARDAATLADLAHLVTAKRASSSSANRRLS